MGGENKMKIGKYISRRPFHDRGLWEWWDNGIRMNMFLNVEEVKELVLKIKLPPCKIKIWKWTLLSIPRSRPPTEKEVEQRIDDLVAQKTKCDPFLTLTERCVYPDRCKCYSCVGHDVPII